MNRINKLLGVTGGLGCDCAVITDRANVRYLSGFTGSSGYLIISENERLIVTDFRYVEQAGIQAKGFEVKNSAGFKFGEYINKFENVAFENDSVSYKTYLWLNENCKKLSPLGDTILNIRSIKDSEEIGYIKQAAAIANEAYYHVIDFMKEGMTERQVARELEFYMLSHGADKLSFDTIVATGDHGSLPHAVPGDKVIRKGDLVVMDYGCVVGGYCSDMTRTVGIGSVDEDSQKAYNTVLKAQLACLEMIKPEVNCAEVHKLSFDIIDSEYPGMYGHTLGHGVGLEVHENPGFSFKHNQPLKPGTVITVEPGVYIPGKCGVRIEDLIVIGDDGFENLCTPPKDLILI